MDLSHILSRAKRGTQELQARSGHVTHQQRAVLLLISGERCAAGILARLSSAGPDIENRAEDLTHLMADDYVVNHALIKAAPQPSKPVPAAPRHVWQASVTDWRLSQADTFSALRRRLVEGPGAPIDLFNGLVAPLYIALTTYRSEVSAHTVVTFLEAYLDEGAPGNVTEASWVQILNSRVVPASWECCIDPLKRSSHSPLHHHTTEFRDD